MSMMSVVVGCLCAGLVVALALIASLQRRVESQLRALPQAVSSAVKREREETGDKPFDPAKATALVAGIRDYHDKLAAHWRTELGDAELRTRMTERRASDAGVALDTAVTLVREAREMVDILVPLKAAAPPVSAEPSHVAAGLGPRPGGSATKSGKPHPPPRKQTLLGILPPPPVAMSNDEDRPSEEEVTKVAPRAVIEAMGTAKTLASMPAIEAPSGKRGAS